MKRLVFLFFVTITATSIAAAQDATLRSRLSEGVVSQNQTEDSAGLQVVAFENGLPVAGLEISTQGKGQVTGKNGTAVFELKPGEHELFIPRMDKSIRYTAVEGAQTQIVINLVSGDEKIESVTKTPETEAKVRDLNSAEGSAVEIAILSEDEGKPVPNAHLMVSGYSGTVASGPDGIARLKLPEGRYTVSAFHAKFLTSVVPSVAVGPETAKSTIKLQPAVNELEEFVVLAPKIQGSLSALVEVRRTASAVTDVLSSEQMARSGDSDAAASLRRVTGLTLIGGKYVYVRGLGERYSAVTLNGAGIPSPEPSRRVVPLDLFPTAMLESVIVQKSATANLPGEFGGGLIQLKSKGVPQNAFVRISISQNIEDTSGSKSYQGGSTDWLGIDDGTRALPGSIRNALQSGTPIKSISAGDSDGFTPEELAQMGRDLKPIYKAQPDDSRPMPNLSLAAGRRWKVSGLQIGTSASILRSSSFDHIERRTLNVAKDGDKLIDFANAKTDYSEQEFKTGAAVDLSVDFNPDHKLRANALLVRHTSDEVEIKESISDPSAGKTNYDRRLTTGLEWTERQLMVRQLSGENLLPAKMKLEWRLQRAEAERDAPDAREYSFYDTTGKYELDTTPSGNSRIWSDLYDVSDEVGAKLSLPLKTFAGPLKLALGFNRLSRDRESNTFRFVLIDRSGDPSFCDKQDMDVGEACYNPSNIHPDGFVLINQTLSADSYRGEQTTNAQFLTAQWELGRKWEIQAGARAEQGEQEVRTYYFHNPGNATAVAGLKTNDVLPSYNLTWKPSDKVRARFAYSETLTRPEFREMAAVGFIDEETGATGIGNFELKGTVIRNFDHRWEYYPSADESISIGFFYKRFIDPIEDTFTPESDSLRKTFTNAKGAINQGVEFESRVALRRVARSLRRWTFANNLTLIDSQIELNNGGNVQQGSRPLQGQSPWVINGQLQYDRPATGTQFAAVYNVVGPRITEVGTFGLPHVYEDPFHQLDLTAQQKISKSTVVGLLARNLLDPEVRSQQGEYTVRSFRRGRSLGVSLSSTF